MWGWLDRLANEGHASERTATRWHLAQVGAYAMLIAGYVCMAFYHVAAAHRHARAAERKWHRGEK